MNVSGNSRYQETESKIREAFISLLESKNINTISVNDLCSYAHISRPSFYSHYDDINDLIVQIEADKSKYISDILAVNRALTLNDFTKYLSYVKENKHFYIAYFQCENNPQLAQTLMNQYLSSNHIYENTILRYHMIFYMAGLKAIVYDWLIHDCIISLEQMSQILLSQYKLFLTYEK